MPLYIIPTPIGNLKDMTLHALDILAAVDVILCEDTRTSSVLLKHYNIHKKLMPFHQHNEHLVTPQIVEQLKSGLSYALITDAGTPGISDPCFLLVRACIQHDIKTECLPGATAFVPALVNSGLPTQSFLFMGFLPLKKRRQQTLKKLASEPHTIILYEAPQRLSKTLNDLCLYCEPDRQIVVCRELTKIHETYYRGSLADLNTTFLNKDVKGEIVLVIQGASSKQTLSPDEDEDNHEPTQ